jgi:hypothetical protein
MISAPTGRCSAVMTGRGRFGMTIRTGQSKFVGSPWKTSNSHIDMKSSAATGPSVLIHKAFGLVSEAVPQRSIAWLLLTQAHKTLL